MSRNAGQWWIGELVMRRCSEGGLGGSVIRLANGWKSSSDAALGSMTGYGGGPLTKTSSQPACGESREAVGDSGR
jgi:hypothetical protein